MKKTLSVLAVLGIMAVGVQSAQAFSWSSLNPAYWGNSACPKCEKPKKECGCKKKVEPCQKVRPTCDPCETGAAAPCEKPKCDPCKKVEKCNPCQKQVKEPCDACDKLQEMNKQK